MARGRPKAVLVLSAEQRAQLESMASSRSKVRDIVGLYLNPPENAVVLCVDEKSQIQALERTQPMLPIGLGYGSDTPPDDPGNPTVDFHGELEKH